MNSYAAAVERLNALGLELHTAPGKPRPKFELGQMRLLMEALGNPQEKFRSVLVAGTNGKGSTCSTLASILAQAGYRTGLYTSPHLSRVNERIQVNGNTISDEEFAALFFRVEEGGAALVRAGRLPGPPSFFETVTAIAFLSFAGQGVHTAILEVGLGGRLDATNIVEPLLSVITDISLDHMEWLGTTIAEIAREKAGILRRGGIMVTLPQHPEANQALGEAAVALNVHGINAAEYMPPPLLHSDPIDPISPIDLLGQAGQAGQAGPAGQATQADSSGTSGQVAQATHAPDALRQRYPVTVLNETIEVDSPLAGEYQQRNLALAIAAAVALRNSYNYDIRSSAIAAGIRATVWPARLELMPSVDGRPPILLDVGHNPGGAWALRAAVSRLDRGQPLTLIFGCLKDKPAAELAQILFPLFHRVVLTPVDSPRSASIEDLLAAAHATGSEAEAAADSVAALKRAIAITPADGWVVIAGSVFLVGKLREELAFAPFVANEILSA